MKIENIASKITLISIAYDLYDDSLNIDDWKAKIEQIIKYKNALDNMTRAFSIYPNIKFISQKMQ